MSADLPTEDGLDVVVVPSEESDGRIVLLHDRETGATGLFGTSTSIADLQGTFGIDPSDLDFVGLMDHREDPEVVADVAGIIEGEAGTVPEADRPTVGVPDRVSGSNTLEALGAYREVLDGTDVEWLSEGGDHSMGDRDPEQIRIGESSIRVDNLGFTPGTDRSDVLLGVTDTDRGLGMVLSGGLNLGTAWETFGGEWETESESVDEERDGLFGRLSGLLPGGEGDGEATESEEVPTADDGPFETEPPTPAETVADHVGLFVEQAKRLWGALPGQLAARDDMTVFVERPAGDDGVFERLFRTTDEAEVGAAEPGDTPPEDRPASSELIDAETGRSVFGDLASGEAGVAHVASDGTVETETIDAENAFRHIGVGDREVGDNVRFVRSTGGRAPEEGVETASTPTARQRETGGTGAPVAGAAPDHETPPDVSVTGIAFQSASVTVVETDDHAVAVASNAPGNPTDSFEAGIPPGGVLRDRLVERGVDDLDALVFAGRPRGYADVDDPDVPAVGLADEVVGLTPNRPRASEEYPTDIDESALLVDEGDEVDLVDGPTLRVTARGGYGAAVEVEGSEGSTVVTGPVVGNRPDGVVEESVEGAEGEVHTVAFQPSGNYAVRALFDAVEDSEVDVAHLFPQQNFTPEMGGAWHPMQPYGNKLDDVPEDVRITSSDMQGDVRIARYGDVTVVESELNEGLSAHEVGQREREDDNADIVVAAPPGFLDGGVNVTCGGEEAVPPENLVDQNESHRAFGERTAEDLTADVEREATAVDETAEEATGARAEAEAEDVGAEIDGSLANHVGEGVEGEDGETERETELEF